MIFTSQKWGLAKGHTAKVKEKKSSKGHGAGAHRQKLAGLVDYQIGEHWSGGWGAKETLKGTDCRQVGRWGAAIFHLLTWCSERHHCEERTNISPPHQHTGRAEWVALALSVCLGCRSCLLSACSSRAAAVLTFARCSLHWNCFPLLVVGSAGG